MILILVAQPYGGLCFGWGLPDSWTRVTCSPCDGPFTATEGPVQQALWCQETCSRRRPAPLTELSAMPDEQTSTQRRAIEDRIAV